MILMLNSVLVFASMRIKEFLKAVDIAKKIISNLKQEEAETGQVQHIPFSIQYLAAVAQYCMSNSRYRKTALIELYRLQREQLASMS